MEIIGNIIGDIFMIIMSLIEPIFGMIATLVKYLIIPLIIVFVIFLLFCFIKLKGTEETETKNEIPNSKHMLNFNSGAKIGYNIEPPNFRNAFNDTLGMRYSCGTCKHCSHSQSNIPVCTKYGVHYTGRGCLDITVCDDFANVLF